MLKSPVRHKLQRNAVWDSHNIFNDRNQFMRNEMFRSVSGFFFCTSADPRQGGGIMVTPRSITVAHAGLSGAVNKTIPQISSGTYNHQGTPSRHASLGEARSISVPLTRNMPYLSHCYSGWFLDFVSAQPAMVCYRHAPYLLLRANHDTAADQYYLKQ